ncbi:site-specific integrase [Robbsia andropogonis]|uniref:site-specific integrase n=1 Tax=Robbsia andropogonis TaxID=28092 RepID=UPI00209F9CC7|nr:site-specific integrase [Robbsia andropogonis]MCP1116992.1 site-specific integrase [Robbsia andropogonis]MCP1126329.1 site-specific integrase [Robbsia andropogonis]
MPVETITKDGRRRYAWSFKRVIEGERIRKYKLFPIGTNRQEADALARQWEAELYAVATGAKKTEKTIGECVRKHIVDKHHEWKDSVKRVGVLEKWRLEYDNVAVSDLHDWSIALTGYMRALRDRDGNPKRKLADASIKNFLAYIRASVRYAYKVGFIETDHSGRMVFPSVANERHNYPDRHQMLAIASKCTDRQTRAAIRVAFYSGMRQAEILRAVPSANGFKLETTKNGKPRVVPIHPRVAVVARRIKFTITQHQLKNFWNRARVKAGFPQTRFHDLRHAAASEMINAGVDLFTVGGVLGHVSLVSTKRYSHLVTDKLSDAVTRIGRR